ncbi:MAG TPA: ANTAR domain-containing protein [Ornithinibacter sp.]|nr:ANTAR domain-containing protein [Ornithinibacter sp.]
MRTDQALRPGTPGATTLLELADALRPLADRATDDEGRAALQELVRIAVAHVPGARFASLTMRRGRRFTTEAATDQRARCADRLQEQLWSGPGLDTGFADRVFVTGDVVADGRWPRWGLLVQRQLGVASLLSKRLTQPEEAGEVVTLTLYSDQREAFDERALGMALVLASHGSLLVTAALARDRARNLLRALESNREIGVAIGILMQSHQVDRDRAFRMLRAASQNSNRKLAAVASDVAYTGILVDGGHRRSRGQRSSAATGSA